MDKTFTVIPDFMLDFDLSLRETVALAVIYGFCQDGSSDFHGSYNYLARKIKVNRRNAMRVIERLEEKGYIIKDVNEFEGVKSCSIRCSFGVVSPATPGVSNRHQGGVISDKGVVSPATPNNISIKNIKENKDIYIPFNFKKALMSLGVTEEHARDFIAVRKTKRATNTETAFRLIEKEITKSGRSADECIRTAVEHSWQGFKAAWLPKESEQPKFVGSDVEGYIKAVYNGSLTR